MPVTIQTDPLIAAQTQNFGDVAQKAYTTTIANLDAIRKGRESATVNKLMAESVDPATGTFDRNKLIGGLANVGLGSQIPDQLANIQSNEMNNLKLAGEKITASQQQLGLIGQLFGGITTKVEYDNAKAKAQELGIDVSKYPEATDDASAASFGKTASNNAVSAADKLAYDYKNSELATRMVKYGQQEAAAKAKLEQENTQFAQSQATIQRGQDIADANTDATRTYNMSKPLPVSEGEKVTQRAEAKYNVGLDIELGKNKQLKENLSKTVEVNGKPVNRLEHLIDTSLGSSIEAGVKNKLGSLTGISTKAATATKELEMEGAKILANIPYPPGAQSDKELEARQKQVGDIANPAIPIETRKALLKDLINYSNTFEQTHPKKLNSGGASSGKSHPLLGTIEPDEEDL